MYLNNHYFYYKCFLKTPCVIKRTRCGLYLHVKIWFAMLQSTFLSTVLITVLGAKVFQHIVQDYNKYVHVNKKYMAIVLKYPKKNYHTCIFLLCTAWHDTSTHPAHWCQIWKFLNMAVSPKVILWNWSLHPPGKLNLTLCTVAMAC